MRKGLIVLILAFVGTLAPLRPATAQVDSEITDATPDPFDSGDPYVYVRYSAWWDGTVWCGIDGGCMDVWCDVDSAEMDLSGDYIHSYRSDGGSELTDYDVVAPGTMQDQWYVGQTWVSWSNGGFGYGDYSEYSVYVQAQTPYPLNVRLTIPGYVTGAHNQFPLIKLLYTYAFDSSTGDPADLAKCEIYERLSYSGHIPPNSTFPGTLNPNNVRSLGSAVNGTFQDEHSTPGPVGIADDAYTTTQRFAYKCNNGPVVDFASGSHKGPHDIVRAVQASPAEFSVSKHGYTRPCNLNSSGSAVGWCQ